MGHIDRLTPDQEARILEYGGEWFRIATSTEPADCSRAEVALEDDPVQQIGFDGPVQP